MYLVVVTVEHPEGGAPPAERLRRAVRESAAASDRLQHAYLEADGCRISFCLYLQAPTRLEALSLADQLCRRTMASVADTPRWRVRSTYIGP
ncbi:hypothetical protein [Sphaerisporangium aureirubrum]|uniref:DUF4242 domain-containing protein n=1 Tax=Sphaerisporangium aureirubrum TaxID=1544736 RepID=A0ABW1NVD3_9ACTN